MSDIKKHFGVYFLFAKTFIDVILHISYHRLGNASKLALHPAQV